MNCPSFFQCLYDQRIPVGSLGRGTHYSVYRSISWHLQNFTPSARAAYHDVAVVWDEHHDERVLDVFSRIHVEGLLAPILFVGERKGTLYVLLEEDAVVELGTAGIEQLTERLRPLADLGTDIWSVDVAAYGADSTGIIQAPQEDVDTYLASIDLLWKLGLKPIPQPDNPIS